jgi:hypothetical protein
MDDIPTILARVDEFMSKRKISESQKEFSREGLRRCGIPPEFWPVWLQDEPKTKERKDTGTA